MSEEKKLYLLGAGIKSLSHLSNETVGYLKGSDRILYLLNEPMMAKWVEETFNNCMSLDDHYFNSDRRLDSYHSIADQIISELQDNNTVSFLIYGHPCFYSMPGLIAASSLAENNNIEVQLVPAISSIDCLYADLAIDPANGGVFVVDATELITTRKVFDHSCHVAILQVSMIGNSGLPTDKTDLESLEKLKDYLLDFYGRKNGCVIYEAPLYPGMKPKIRKFLLEDLCEQELSTLSTLYIYPELEQKSKPA